MAISSPGVGSGLDVNSIVTQLVAIEKQPLTNLQTKANTLQTQLSLYGTIKSQVAALQDASTALLTTGSSWIAQTATSSLAAVTVSATSSASAANFSVDVTRLAQAQTVAAKSLTAGAPIGAGSGTGKLTIQLGSWGSGGAGPFTPGSSAAVDVDVNETDSYATIAAAINAKNAGVTATVLKNGTTERLSIRSTTTGADAGFTITSDSGFAALDSLSFTALTNGAESSSGMEANQMGLNATYKLNGVALESATNTVTNVVTGVTLGLQQLTSVGSPAQIAITQDKSAVQKAVQAFADAYSALTKTLADSTKYVQGGKSGVLQGDSTTVGLLTLIRRVEGSVSTGSSFSRLSDVGLELQTDGSLKVNSTKLTSAMSDMTDFKKFFAADNSDNATNGFALKFRDLAKGLNDFDGRVTSKADALQRQITQNGKDQDKVNLHAAAVEKQLRAQYSALDSIVAQNNSLNSYVTAQLAQWNKTSG